MLDLVRKSILYCLGSVFLLCCGGWVCAGASSEDAHCLADSIYNEPSFVLLQEHIEFSFNRLQRVSPSLYRLMGFYKAVFVTDTSGQDFFSLTGVDSMSKTLIDEYLSTPCSDERAEKLFKTLLSTLLHIDKSHGLGLDMVISTKRNCLVFSKVLVDKHFVSFVNRLVDAKYLSDNARLVILYQYLVAFCLLSKLYESEMDNPFVASESPIKIDISKFHARLKRVRRSRQPLSDYVNRHIGQDNIYMVLGTLTTGGVSVLTDKMYSTLSGSRFDLRQSVAHAVAPMAVMVVSHLIKKCFLSRSRQ